MLQAGPLISHSPSFTTTAYSSSSAGNLAEIAARVVNELRRENPQSAANFLFDDDHDQPWLHRDESDDGSESEFEFASAAARDSPISADEIFHNGQIKAVYVYPLFGKNLVDLKKEEEAKTPKSKETSQGSDGIALLPRRRQALRKLMGEEEEEWNSTSCSSSSASEIDDGLRPGTYCAWDPNHSKNKKKNRISDSEKKKSRSTGTSRRWNLRDLILNRSSSDGGPKEPATKQGGKVAAATEETEEEKRPYNKKKDLVGFLSNVNGLSRNLHPF